MTEWRPRDLGAADPARRHRPRAGGPGRLPARRVTRVLLGCATAVAAVTAVLGYAATGTPEPDALPPPAALLPLPPDPSAVEGADALSPSGTPRPASAIPPTPSTVAPGAGGSLAAGPAATTGAAAQPPPPVRRPGPVTAAPDGGGQGVPGAGAPATVAPPPAEPLPTPPPAEPLPAPPPPAPRVVGPTTTAGFDSLLDDYCEARRYRGALLLNGRRDPTDGRWVCARFGDLDTIDLDDACQDAFSGSARARTQISGDIRTMRCFGS